MNTKTHLTEQDFKDPFDIRKGQSEKILSCYGKTSVDLEKAEKEKEAKKDSEIDDFKHNRLMTGYHSIKADELSDEARQLGASSNAEIHGVAKEKKAEATRHTKIATEYRDKAKKLHNVEKHGDWNDTVPGKAEAIKYGSKQSKKADKKTNLVKQEEDMETDFKDDDDLTFTDEEKKKVKKSEAFDILGVKETK